MGSLAVACGAPNDDGWIAAWFERLTGEGIIKGGQPLMDTGRIVSGKNGRVVADGPFVESKEAVGGYVLVTARDMDHAIEIARGFPIINHGVSVEIRPVAAKCATMQRAQDSIADQYAAAPSA